VCARARTWFFAEPTASADPSGESAMHVASKSSACVFTSLPLRTTSTELSVATTHSDASATPTARPRGCADAGSRSP
jgi:hypothetical protein